MEKSWEVRNDQKRIFKGHPIMGQKIKTHNTTTFKGRLKMLRGEIRREKSQLAEWPLELFWSHRKFKLVVWLMR